MNCESCGTPLEESQTSCEKCGAPVLPESVQQPVVTSASKNRNDASCAGLVFGLLSLVSWAGTIVPIPQIIAIITLIVLCKKHRQCKGNFIAGIVLISTFAFCMIVSIIATLDHFSNHIPVFIVTLAFVLPIIMYMLLGIIFSVTGLLNKNPKGKILAVIGIVLVVITLAVYSYLYFYVIPELTKRLRAFIPKDPF